MKYVINYYDSLGNKVSKKVFDSEWNLFMEELEKEYNKKVTKIMDSIPEELDDVEKMKILFMWIIDNVSYEHNLDYNVDGSVSVPLVKIYNNWGIQVSDKFAPIFLNRAICSGLSSFFADLCQRLNIKCELIRGETRILDNGSHLKHMWNVVFCNGEAKHVDVTYGIFNKEKGEEPLKYFFISDEELKELGPHDNYIFPNIGDKKL